MKKEGTERQIAAIKQLRAKLKMNRTEFSKEIGIPLRTLEEWESGNRKMPDYQVRMLVYYVMGRYVWFRECDELFGKMLKENQL